MIETDRLRSLPLFNMLREEERATIAPLVDEVDVPAGERLVEQGQIGYEFFVIQHGQADAYADGERIAELGPDDFFGEVAPLETGRRTATVTAVSPMKLVVVSGENFERIRAEHPQVAERLHEALRQRVVIPSS